MIHVADYYPAYNAHYEKRHTGIPVPFEYHITAFENDALKDLWVNRHTTSWTARATKQQQQQKKPTLVLSEEHSSQFTLQYVALWYCLCLVFLHSAPSTTDLVGSQPSIPDHNLAQSQNVNPSSDHQGEDAGMEAQVDSDDNEVVEGVQPPVATEESYHMSSHPVHISKWRATGIGICCNSRVSQEEISQGLSVKCSVQACETKWVSLWFFLAP